MRVAEVFPTLLLIHSDRHVIASAPPFIVFGGGAVERQGHAISNASVDQFLLTIDVVHQNWFWWLADGAQDSKCLLWKVM